MNDAKKFKELRTRALKLLFDGSFAEARQGFEQALDLAQRVKPSRVDLGSLYDQLGTACRRLGDFEAADQYLGHAVTIFQELGKPAEVSLALALHERGRVWRGRRDNDKAWEYFTEELAIWKSMLPDRMRPDYVPYTAASLYSCGLVLADRGSLENARQNFEQALELRRLSLPPDHPDIAESLASLGDVCAAVGDIPHAIQYLSESLPILTGGLGADHPLVVKVRQKLEILGRRPAVG